MTAHTLSKTKSFPDLIEQAEKSLAESFRQIDAIALTNQKRVLQAFKDNRLREEHFAECTGYGLHDSGREAIDNIFAQVMQAPAGAVRLQFVSGTHTIACALLGNLKSGERMISLTGRPYDTLLPVIGLVGSSEQSLISSGVIYEELDFAQTIKLLNSNINDKDFVRDVHTANSGVEPSMEKESPVIAEILGHLLKPPTKLVHIQKSCGYSASRRSLSNEEIGKLCRIVRSYSQDVMILVDNCYGEFVEDSEPPACGADLIAGSLIKNPGGGLAITGGYLAGKSNFVERALTRLTAPGLDGRLGVLYNQNRLVLQGLFIAPAVVSNAVKGAMLSAFVLEKVGFKVNPQPLSRRFDIVQRIEFGNQESLVRFCQAVQSASPVDSHVVPEPAPMPGYTDQVIMAAGTFIQGASIELSADGPMRPPYVAYLQGGLTYLHIKCMLENVLEYLGPILLKLVSGLGGNNFVCVNACKASGRKPVYERQA